MPRVNVVKLYIIVLVVIVLFILTSNTEVVLAGSLQGTLDANVSDPNLGLVVLVKAISSYIRIAALVNIVLLMTLLLLLTPLIRRRRGHGLIRKGERITYIKVGSVASHKRYIRRSNSSNGERTFFSTLALLVILTIMAYAIALLALLSSHT